MSDYIHDFTTIRYAISDGGRIMFARELAEHDAKGWQIVNSGLENGYFWAILRRERQ